VLEVKLEEVGLYDHQGTTCQNNLGAEAKLVRYSFGEAKRDSENCWL
jgi:hypothetical protein